MRSANSCAECDVVTTSGSGSGRQLDDFGSIAPTASERMREDPASMLVVLDSNTFHGDRYGERWALGSLIGRAETGEFEIVVPRIVVEELVRQFPHRLEDLKKSVKGLENDLKAFGIEPPSLPDLDSAALRYRTHLEKRLSLPGCRIADHPRAGEAVGEWVARRRKPIKADGTGAPDALVWLTTVELASANPDEEIVLISANTSDFAAGKRSSELHESLLSDLDEAGIDRSHVNLVLDVFEFHALHPAAVAEAQTWLKDNGNLETIKAAIADELEWYPIEDFQSAYWGLPAPDVEDVHVNGFTPDSVEVATAEDSDGDFQMLLRARGEALLDFSIFKYDIAALDESDRARVIDFDWNESFALCEMNVELAVEIEAFIPKKGDLRVSVLAVEGGCEGPA